MDETAQMLALADRMLWTAALVAAPVLIGALVVGLVVAVIQAATSINEATLTFLPKLITVGLMLVVLGGAMLGLIGDFMKDVMAQIAAMGH